MTRGPGHVALANVLCPLLICVASQAPVRGAAAGGEKARPSAGPATESTPARGAIQARIAVIIAGDLDCAPEVRALLDAQLADVTAGIDWSCQTDLDSDEPFLPTLRTGPDARVWVDLSPRDEARLTLRDEAENRYFVRRLPLARGLDEIGREEIAAVVRSATLAMLTGERGALTRAEAQAAVSQWPAATPRAAPPPVRAATAREATHVTPQTIELPRQRLSIEVGPAWSVQALARQIPAAQEAALTAALTGRHLSVWAELGYRLPVVYDGQPFGVRLTALSLRAGMAVWTSPDRPLRWGAGAGAVAKRIWFSPRDDATVEAAGNGFFDALAGRVFFALRYLVTERLALGVDVHCEIATADVHFDFRDQSGTTQRTVTQWPVQPGLGVVAAWRWGGARASEGQRSAGPNEGHP
ncbi:MAG TPA: hypothetical protein VGP07_23405 [Polyangia bacterium]|jgi:hypothetical protein